MRMETLFIETAAGPVAINKVDFDPNIHKLSSPENMPLPTGGVVPAETQTTKDANGNNVNPGDGGQFVPAPELRTDGPTVAEFVTSGYQASNYPPTGYASRSTPEEIAAAVEQQKTSIAKTDMLVQKISAKKFIVVDKNGAPVPAREGIDADGYKSDTDAWTAIMALPA